jgi:hypothetical protein
MHLFNPKCPIMLERRRPSWSAIVIAVLLLLLNVIIIKSSYADDKTLFLMLVVSIPLLAIAIYNACQADHLRRSHLFNSLQPLTLKRHFKLLSHLIYPTKLAPTELKVQIGNDQCTQPYHALIFNVGSMKYSDLASTSIEPLKNKEIEYSECSTDEGLKTYHLAGGGLVLRIGPDYPECSTENGHFNSNAFKKTAQRPEVKMIELKLLPTIRSLYADNSLLNIAGPIQRKIDNNRFSGSAHTAFRNAEGMIHFLNNLRELSGGKPIGIRLCIDDKKKLYQICHAARKTELIPDFIVVEGSGKNIIHSYGAIQTRINLYDALLFVTQTLQMYGLQNRIKVIADGNITSGFQILKVLALGANAVCTEMPNYTTLMKDTLQLMKVCGFKSVKDISLSKFLGSLDELHSKILEIQNDRVLHADLAKKVHIPQMRLHPVHDLTGK